jgi:AraC-like DNA-binding protein
MTGFRLTIRSASLKGYPELASSLGLDAALMMRRAGLPKRCLDDLETQVSADAVQQLLEASAQASGAEDFGLRLASKRHLSNLGPISLVLREEPTALQALETLCRYLRLLNASLFTRVEQQADQVVIREEVLVERAASARQAIEMAIGVMMRILHDLLGAQWRPRRVCFAHRAPRDARTHHELFGPNVEFNAAFNGIVCDARELNQQLPRTDPDMARYARSFLDKALGAQRQGDLQAIRQLVGVLLPGGRCTAEQVAQHLGVDRRTMHRRLSAEGETFSSVLRSVRRELAQRQLADADRTGAEVAGLLGFSGSSAFAHWFGGEFGCTVSTWRRQHRQQRQQRQQRQDEVRTPP